MPQMMYYNQHQGMPQNMENSLPYQQQVYNHQNIPNKK